MSRLPVLLGLVLACAASVTAADPGWRAGIADASPMLTVTTTVEATVYPGTAVVRVSQTFDNAGNVDVTAPYAFAMKNAPVEPVFRTGEGAPTTIAVAETVRDDDSVRKTPKQVQLERQLAQLEKQGVDAETLERIRLRLAPPGTLDSPRPAVFKTEPVRVPANDSVTVSTEIPVPLRAEGRELLLDLPGLGALAPEAPLPVRLIVTIPSADRLTSVRSSTHDILSDFEGDRTVVETVSPTTDGRREFSLAFSTTDEDRSSVAGILHFDAEGRRGVEAVVHPPEVIPPATIRPKELVFLVDSSGSMKQFEKMDDARRAVAYCLRRMRPEDRFNILEFDTGVRAFRPSAVAPDDETIDRAEAWLAGVEAEGGTQMRTALEAALDTPADDARHRMLVAVTDGMLQDIDEVLEVLDRKLGDRRLFVVGAGSLHQQHNLLRLADHGRGAATFTNRSESLETTITEFFASIADPVAWDIELDWDGGTMEPIETNRIPDLYAGRPVRVLAWADGDLPQALHVRMKTVDGEQYFLVNLPGLTSR